MNVNNSKKQSGAVLILLFVALIISFTTVILAALNNRNPQLQDRSDKLAEMQKIKETLLGYGMGLTSSGGVTLGPGRLPCPDRDNDGDMECGGGIIVSRLPVSVEPPTVASPVQLNDRYAGVDQQFWLAVSRRFQQDITSLNSASSTPLAPLLSLDGVTNYAALIIAPGPALAGQNRNGGSQIDRYLEATTGNMLTTFISTHATAPALYNDMIVPITVAEVMSLATVRVAQEMQRVMNYYHSNNGTYPLDQLAFANEMNTSAVVPPPAAWVNANAWVSVATYKKLSPGEATIEFANCAIVYTLNSAPSLVRSPSAC